MAISPSERLALSWLIHRDVVAYESLPADAQQIISALSTALPALDVDPDTREQIEAHQREAAEITRARDIATYNRARVRAQEIEENDQAARVAVMVDALCAELVDTAGLDTITPLVPVVDGLLYRGTVARLNGRPGSMKSFAALDMAACVGSGIPWAGHPCSRGPVLYLVAEGAGGLTKRVRAWERDRGRPMTGVHFLPRPVQISSIEWLVLEEACRRIRPVLVIVDTQARATVGIDESSNERMSVVFARVERLARESDACALLVHHTGHAGDHGRGASNILGAVQTELLVRKEGKGAERVITIRIDKTKDDDDEQEIRFLPRVVTVDSMIRPATGEPETSLVLVPERGQVFAIPGLDPAVSAAVSALDRHGAPVELGRDRLRTWLADRGLSVGTSVLASAISYRRKRAEAPPDQDKRPADPELPVT